MDIKERVQKVIDKYRNRLIKERDEFETKMHDTQCTYGFGCRECGTVTMTTKQPLYAWHECPSCRQMIYLDKIKPQKIRIAEDGEHWQEMLRESLEE